MEAGFVGIGAEDFMQALQKASSAAGAYGELFTEGAACVFSPSEACHA